MNPSRIPRGLLLAAGFFLCSCAGPKRPPESAATARLKDSAPERIAAQRAATPGLALEAEDQRWGIAAARERKQARDLKTAKAANASRGTTRVDLAPLPTNP